MEDEVKKWKETVQRKVESWLRPYIFGQFMSFPHALTTAGPRLPCIYTYFLTGVPTAANDLQRWLSESRLWRNVLGESLSEYYWFKEGDRIVSLRCETQPRTLQLYLLKLADEFLGVFYEVDDLLDDLQVPFTLLSYVESVQSSLAVLRSRARDRLGRRPFGFGLGGDVDLHHDILLQSAFIERLAVEVEDGKHALDDMTASLRPFTALLYEKDRPRPNLHEALFEPLYAILRPLQSQVQLVAKGFASHMELHNMHIIYVLQIQVFIWTVVVTVLTAIVGWKDVRTLWESLFPR